MTQSYRLLAGIAFVLGACSIWGLIFVIPQFMVGFNYIEIAVGRYLFYGLASLIFFLLTQRERYSRTVWKTALIYAFLFSIGYYPCLILGLQYASPAISALIMGVGPITIALYGNWRKKECAFRTLLVPSLLILVGLIFVNYPALVANETPATYLLGFLTCLCALVTWTWYVVANARFLNLHPEISSSRWATLNGVATLMVVGVCGGVTLFFAPDRIEIEKYMQLTPELKTFLWGSLVLGVICSWGGIFLWNRAVSYLPLSLAGQLTIFETVFGLLFIYLIDQRLPPLIEGVGILLFLISVGWGIKKSAQMAPPLKH